MTSTRVTTLVAFVGGSVGFALAALATSTPQALAGGGLVMASAIYLVRHFWRESDQKRKQELAAHRTEVSLVLTELHTTSRQVEGSLREVESSLRADARQITNRVDQYFRAVLEYVAQIQLDLGSAKKDMTGVVETLRRHLKQFELAERRAARGRTHVVSEVSGVIGVYSALNPQIPYPPFGGWSISGDCARRLVELILTNHFDSVIEVGSGLSTLLIAQALEVRGGNGRCIALEHEKSWIDRSNQVLAEHGVSNRAVIVHAPLVDTEIRGENFPWYDLSEVELPDQIGMLFIDGPPKATGTLARYPALPLMIERLGSTSVVLMDDADRPDERAVTERWKAEFPDLAVVRHSDAKGTVEIRRAPP